MIDKKLIDLLAANVHENGRDLVTTGGRSVPVVEGIPDFLSNHADTEIGDVYDAKCDGEAAWRAVGYKSSAHYHNTHDAVRRAIGTLNGQSTILDIGCGHGELTKSYTEIHTVVGVDMSHKQLLAAQSKGLFGVRADACDLPFRNNLFDVVVMSEVIQHVDEIDTLLSGIQRVTKPGGKVIISTINQDSIVRRVYRIYTRRKEISKTRLRNAASLAEATHRHGLEKKSLIWIHSPARKLSQTKKISALHSAAATNFVLLTERVATG